jgi:rsbT antagonist protein RsbS
VTGHTAPVSILRQGPYLIVSVHAALDDLELTLLRGDLVEQIGRHRSRGVIVDVAALDVLDSFGAQTLREIAQMARLRGALTVVVGIAPDVAFTMVELAEGLGAAAARLDLEDALEYLDACLDGRSPVGGSAVGGSSVGGSSVGGSSVGGSSGNGSSGGGGLVRGPRPGGGG